MPVEELSPFGQFIVLCNMYMSLFGPARRRKKVSTLAAVWGLVGFCTLPIFATYAFVRVCSPHIAAHAVRMRLSLIRAARWLHQRWATRHELPPPPPSTV
jgi:hypothetical protein